MSRIGKQPIKIPTGVKAIVAQDQVSIEGPKGKLQYRLNPNISVQQDGAKIIVTMVGKSDQARADYGSARAHLNNMILGVSQGWKRSLELNGVGFNAKVQGANLVLAVGFSHEVVMPIPTGIKCMVTKTQVDMESSDRELLGTFASKVRKVQPPEPYLGKGIKYLEEKIRRKAGKTAKK